MEHLHNPWWAALLCGGWQSAPHPHLGAARVTIYVLYPFVRLWIFPPLAYCAFFCCEGT